MYPTGLILFGSACLIFSTLVGAYPWYSVLGVSLLLLLTIWHPYYFALMGKRRVVLRYVIYNDVRLGFN